MYGFRQEPAHYLTSVVFVKTPIENVFLVPELGEIVLFNVDGCIVLKPEPNK